MSTVTRKLVILAAAGAAALLAARGAVIPGEAQARAATTPIRHIVVLYLENHTFDNLFGFWCNQHPGRCPDGGMPASVTMADGSVVIPHVMPDLVPPVDHSIKGQLAAIDGGKMDGWDNLSGCQAAQGYGCVAGYQPGQVPNLSALAATFAVSDRFFSLAASPSWGGHLDIVTSNLDGFAGTNPSPAKGVSPGQGWGCDSDQTTPLLSGQYVPACVPDPSLRFHGAPLPNGGAFEPTPVGYEPTIMDELTRAGLSWKLYAGVCPQETPAHRGLMTCTATSGYGGYQWAICSSLAECLYSQTANTAATPVFVSDAQSGNLPAFSVVTPGSTDTAGSCHNGFSMTACDNFAGQVASAVMNDTTQWPSTVLFITWDDCGCFYDQVPPPRNPDGTQQGPRVPLLIVSPYARPAYTDTTPASFASILAFTEQNFGLPALGGNDAQAYNLSGAFNYAQPPLQPLHLITRPVPTGDHILWAQAQQDS